MSMSGKFALDTNIVIGIFASDNSILQNLKLNPHIFLPSIVLGELYYGAMLSKQSKQNVQRIEKFAKNCLMLNCDEYTSLVYGKVKAALKTIGRPIPENDIWIAALVIQHKLKLATRDRHFDFIEGLEKVEW
jgi:tRNA(fMet)-specific endonuclease VapC